MSKEYVAGPIYENINRNYYQKDGLWYSQRMRYVVRSRISAGAGWVIDDTNDTPPYMKEITASWAEFSNDEPVEGEYIFNSFEVAEWSMKKIVDGELVAMTQNGPAPNNWSVIVLYDQERQEPNGTLEIETLLYVLDAARDATHELIEENKQLAGYKRYDDRIAAYEHDVRLINSLESKLKEEITDKEVWKHVLSVVPRKGLGK